MPKGSEAAFLDSQSHDMLPVSTVPDSGAPQSRPIPASFGVWGARTLALSFSHLDSHIDAIGLSDHVFFLRDQPQSVETGRTELVIRVNFLESQSWIKKAKPRDEVYSFFPGGL